VRDFNERKASRVYRQIEGSGGFYRVAVTSPLSQSRMSVVFRIKDGDRVLEKQFSEEAEKEGMLALYGHPVVGGCRVTLYNGIGEDSVDALIDFMLRFQSKNQ
jgi:phosphoserine aminotransferase